MRNPFKRPRVYEGYTVEHVAPMAHWEHFGDLRERGGALDTKRLLQFLTKYAVEVRYTIHSNKCGIQKEWLVLSKRYTDDEFVGANKMFFGMDSAAERLIKEIQGIPTARGRDREKLLRMMGW